MNDNHAQNPYGEILSSNSYGNRQLLWNKIRRELNNKYGMLNNEDTNILVKIIEGI